MNLFQIFGEIFSSRPAPTGNADVDEVRLYNYLEQPCDECQTKPAHSHGGALYHCDRCCQLHAQRRIAEATAAAAGERSKPA